MIGLRLIWSAKQQWLLLRSKFVSLIIVLLSHLALAMVPRLFPFLSLLAMLPIAALIMVSTYALAGWLRRLLDMTASAPAMVISHILFIWGVHITVVREAIPNLLDAALSMECVLLLIGLYRISYGDPGIVPIESTCTGALGQTDSSAVDLPNKSSPLLLRVRYCYFCKRNVKGFDHHCPAFGNCIGQKNHHLFMVLVIGFIITETTFTMCSNQYIKVSSGAHSVRFEGFGRWRAALTGGWQLPTIEKPSCQLGFQHTAFLFPTSSLAGAFPDLAHILYMLQHQN